MQIYLFPIAERYVLVGPPPHVFETLFYIDGQGVMAYHNDTQIVTAGLVKEKPFTVRPLSYRIEADEPEEALEIFSKAVLAEDGVPLKTRAIWLDLANGRLIEELPECDLMHLNDESEIICGPPDLSDPTIVGLGEHGMCIIQATDFGPPFRCPVRAFRNEVRRKKKRGRLPVVRIKGYPFIRASQVMLPRHWG